MKILLPHGFYHAVGALSLFVLLLSGCAQDQYQRRADVMKDHVENFYSHLKANRVGSAVHENEQIELMADQMADTVKKRGRMGGLGQVEREFALMKTARETSAQNWIALGQYFTLKQQPDRARASYQRVIDTYTNPTEQVYREQAARALKDLDIVSAPSPDPTH
ncbi:MAG: hypothetical protein KF751_17780 [Nitrospira sp.]|nr:hypothetical protein [Nitrospira sp.]